MMNEDDMIIAAMHNEIKAKIRECKNEIEVQSHRLKRLQAGCLHPNKVKTYGFKGERYYCPDCDWDS